MSVIGATGLSRRRLLRASLAGPALLLGASALSACAQAPGRAPRPVFHFDEMPPLAFDVAEVVVELAYVPPGKAPFVDHKLSVTPSQAAALWARERLKAAGQSRRMVFEVNEASVVESLVDGGAGGGGLLTEVILRYEARMVINVHIYEDSGFQAATAKVSGERSVTIPESASAVERDAAWNQLLMDLMSDIDVQLEATLLEVFGDYVVR